MTTADYRRTHQTYQLLPRDRDGVKLPIENFMDRRLAVKRKVQLMQQGCTVDFWDVLKNPLSTMFRL